jgi:TatD DNase family protein
MMHPVDIHTHRIPLIAGTAIESVAPEEFSPRTGGWYSLGNHPWYIEREGHLFRETFLSLLTHPQVLAVGEAGLDKLTNVSMKQQITVFREQMELSELVKKPLIIHSVRANNELIQLKKDIRPTQPWIIHGFRGKAALAEMLLNQGFYLSFGAKYQEEALRITPLERLFLETDDSDVSIGDLYMRAAFIKGISDESLHHAVAANISSTFF